MAALGSAIKINHLYRIRSRISKNIVKNYGTSVSSPKLIDKATEALDSARSSAEVLEARNLARVAYDAAKSAGRMAKAKKAHDSLVSEVHRAQAHALAIRARAEMRLAEEYDAAQEWGEVKSNGGDRTVDLPNSADIGLRRDEIHDARKLRDAEAESQERTLPLTRSTSDMRDKAAGR